MTGLGKALNYVRLQTIKMVIGHDRKTIPEAFADFEERKKREL